MRAELSGEMDMGAFKGTLQAMLPARANIHVAEARKKDIILMGTKETHCLGDILLKHYSGELNANILAIVSNYEELKTLTDKFNIPYHCVSHEGLNRAEHEAKVLDVLSQYSAEV